MSTSTAARAISGGASPGGIAAGDAHLLAGITYRQLDHWARQGWVRPSVDPGKGRSGRRQYAVGDVVLLDLLRHLAESRVNTAAAGPVLAGFQIPDGDVRVLWGPVGSKEPGEPGLHVVPGVNTLDLLEEGGAWVVYNPARIRSRMARHAVAPATATDPMTAPAPAPLPAPALAREGRRSA